MNDEGVGEFARPRIHHDHQYNHHIPRESCRWESGVGYAICMVVETENGRRGKILLRKRRGGMNGRRYKCEDESSELGAGMI